MEDVFLRIGDELGENSELIAVNSAEDKK